MAAEPGESRREFGRVPTTLYSSLVARIDALGGARTVAQTGAVLGRSSRTGISSGCAPAR